MDTGKGTLDTASASVEGMAAHLSNSGQLFDTSALKAAGFNMALNAGISLAMALGARLYYSLSVTLEEQTAIVDELTKSYTHLQKEANALQFSSPDNLTAKDQEQLDFLERKIKLERESLLLENQKLADSELFGKGDLNPFTNGIVGQAEDAALKYTISESYINTYTQRLNDIANQKANGMSGNWEQREAALKQSLLDESAKLLEYEKQFLTTYETIKQYIDSGIYDNNDAYKEELQTLADQFLSKADAVAKTQESIRGQLGNISIESATETFYPETGISLGEAVSTSWSSTRKKFIKKIKGEITHALLHHPFTKLQKALQIKRKSSLAILLSHAELLPAL